MNSTSTLPTVYTTVKYQPATATTSPVKHQFDIQASADFIAGLWIGALVLSDLNDDERSKRLTLTTNGKTLTPSINALNEYWVSMANGANTNLSFSLDPINNPKLNVKHRYLALLHGPKSFSLVQFDTLDFIKGVAMANQILNPPGTSPEKLIHKVVDWPARRFLKAV